MHCDATGCPLPSGGDVVLVKLELEKVIGLTTSSANGLSCNVVTGDLAYLAGCVVVIYNVKANCQTRFLMAPKSPKAFSCVAYSSQGGKFIAAGESGHQPAVIVWEVATGSCIADMRTHKYGVSGVQFSPNGKHLVSIGVPHDGYVCLWDWKSGTLLAKSRASTASLPACAMQFASDGSFLVTGGAKHLKHWIIGQPKARSAGGNANIGMEGKSVKLGSQKESSFVSISCAPPLKEPTPTTPDFQPLYALTAGGVLCLLHCGLAIEKWVDLKVRHGHAIAVSESHVGCACSDGIVRIFMHGSLTYAATLPRPAPYGYHGLTDPNVGATLAVGHRLQPGIRFPDAVACSFLHEGQKLAVIYGDHSLFVWDVRSFSKIGRYRTFLSHSACIWDVTILPTPQQTPALQLTSEKDCIPGGAFATCSADGTIRLWYLGLGQEGNGLGNSVSPTPSMRPANVYSKDILGVLYIDGKGEQKERLPTCATDEEPVDSSHGFRSLCASPDGQQLAAGDRSGNLRIYDLNALQLISFQEAHDAEILSLSFTSFVHASDNLVDEPVCMPLLASGGRDRLIHIYDVNRDYDVIETLDDHSASITAVKFACNGSKLLSCSADKSVVFRNVVASSTVCKSTRYHQEIAPRGVIYDMDTDPADKHAVTVGQDKKLNVLNLASGKPVRCFKPEGDVGEPIKVRVDPSGMYVVCSHSDKYMRVYDFSIGELIAQASGHAEVITGVTFLPDCRRLISVSGDSCIFVWRLPLTLSRSMRKRCIAQAESCPPPRCLKSVIPRALPKVLARTTKSLECADQLTAFDPLKVNVKAAGVSCGNEGSAEKGQEETSDFSVDLVTVPKEKDLPQQESSASRKLEAETPAGFKFSVSRLPPWAQAKVTIDDTASSDSKPDSKGDGKSLQSFESRWAERLGRDGYKLFSEVPGEITSPANIRAGGCDTCRHISLEEGSSINTDSTPESIPSQPEASPSLSPREPLRREPHWKTVHTILFDEVDFSQTESPAKNGLLKHSENGDEKEDNVDTTAHANETNELIDTAEEKVTKKSPLKGEKRDQVRAEAEDEDGVVIGLSDDDRDASSHKSDNVVPKYKSSDEKEDDTIVYYETPGVANTCTSNKDGDDDMFDDSSRRKRSLGGLENFTLETMDHPQTAPCSPFDKTKQASDNDAEHKRIFVLESPKVSADCECTKEDEEEGDDESSPRKDLFSAHFDKLASDLKVAGTARRSFSARFFARSNPSLSQVSLFETGSSPTKGRMSKSDTQALLQDDDLDNNPGRLLAAERERLKLRERQDKMAVEVQRMRQRLVKLGIAVAEIAHEGETTETHKIVDGEERNSDPGPCSLPPLPPTLLPAVSPHEADDAAEKEAVCMASSPSMLTASSAHSRNLPNPPLPSVLVDPGAESSWGYKTSAGILDRACGNGKKASSFYGLDSGVPSKLGTPRTPATTFTPRILDGRKLDLWPNAAKEEPAGGRKQPSLEKVAIRLPTGPHVRLDQLCLHMDGGLTNRREKGTEDKGLGCQIDLQAPKNVGSLFRQVDQEQGLGFEINGLGLRGEKPPAKGAVSRMTNSGRKCLEDGVGSPCVRASVSLARLVERLTTERVEQYREGQEGENLGAKVAISPAKAVGRGLPDCGERSIEEFGAEHQIDNKESSESSSNIDKKVHIHSCTESPSCDYSPGADASSSVTSTGRGTAVGEEKCIEDLETGFQLNSQGLRVTKLAGRSKSISINDYLGLPEMTDTDSQEGLLFSASEPLIGEIFATMPPLPRPIKDYEKSLKDLMEAADRATSLFGEVRSICQRTCSPPEAPVTPGTPSCLPTDILLLGRTYQKVLPGTLQMVQRLADDAAACVLPSECNKDIKFAEENNYNYNFLNDYNFGKSHDYGVSQSRPGTGASSTDSLLASVDVEGFISRYSETLASQVLALVQKALPTKQP